MPKLFLKGRNDTFILGLALIMITCFLPAGVYAADSETYKGDIVTGVSGGSAETENYRLDISVGDAVSGEFESENYKAEVGTQTYLGKDSTPPFLKEQYASTSTPKKGDKLILSVQWKDDSPPISVEFWDSHNNWSKPQSVYSLQTAEFIFDTAGLDGAIKWKSRAKDIFENSNTSPEIEFTIGAVDEEKPKVSAVFNSNDKPSQGEKITLNVKASDNFGLKEIVFEINGVKQEPKKVGGKEETAIFEIDTSTYQPGTEIKWKAYIKDGADLEIITDMKTFTVQAALAKPQCSDGKDNDADGLIDTADPGCSSLDDNDETDDKDKTDDKIIGVKKTCVDGTEYGKCSNLKPKQCIDGSLVDKCSECGCPEGYDCTDEKCELVIPDTLPVAWISGGVVAAAIIGFGGFLLFKRKTGKKTG